jgi:hypothetical protein
LNLKQERVKHLSFKCLKGYSQSCSLQFVEKGSRNQTFRIFVDGENCDSYRLAAMFDSLNGYKIQKIDKVVVYYDELNSSKAWLQLKFFTYNVEVEPVVVERIKEDKSLVDHKLLPVFQKQYIRRMWIL